MRLAWLKSVWFLFLLTSFLRISNALVCSSINVHNTVEGLKDLDGCTVVEGHVKIVLLELANETDFEPYCFPELREITQFLMFYRVRGLRSLGKLFPNLEKIGGDPPSEMDLTLVVDEMFSLQEIGLESLKEITRGSVIIFQNPCLCYVNTVDWDRITKGHEKHNYVAQNHNPLDCPGCLDHCPLGLCWSGTQCQIDVTQSRDCHPLCVGGCSEPGPRGCYSCRGVLDLDGDCVEACPPGTYQYLNRRCVTKDNCTSNMSDFKKASREKNKNYVIFEDKCLKSCPSGFEPSPEDKECIPCSGGKCLKWCLGREIKSMKDAEALRGCTHINGSLEIVIKTENSPAVFRELEENLRSIKEITGHLKIRRSSVTDLNFLKDLSVIHGRTSNTTKKYALHVSENQNLQELWDWDKKETLTILDGRLFFHFNPKLCLQHIYKLTRMIHYDTSFSSFEIGKESNGDKFPCNATNLQITVTFKSFNVIEIHVPYIRINSTPILRYVLYYIKDPYKNITMFDDIDVCSDYGWKTKDIPVDTNDSYCMTHGFRVNLTELEPDTLYLFYVTSYTVSSISAKSGMNYECTLPATPSELTRLHAYSNSSTDIVLQWEPPKHVNGKLKEYLVTWSLLKEDETMVLLRDYCAHPMDSTQEDVPKAMTQKNEIEIQDCCVTHDHSNYFPKEGFGNLCSKFKNCKFPIGFPEKVKFSKCESYFYSYVYSSPFYSNTDNIRLKRQSSNSSSGYKHFTFNYNYEDQVNSKNQYPNKYSDTMPTQQQKLSRLSASSLGMTITGLTHFQDYVISVRACRESDPEEPYSTEDLRCSKTEIIAVRTLKDEVADTIPETIRLGVNESTLSIWWNVPDTPNGLVVAFEIQYRQRNLEFPNQITECITYTEYEAGNRRHLISSLSTGRYEIRVRSISLAGKGPFTNFIPFDIDDENVSLIEIIFILLVVLVFVSLLFLLLYLLRIQNEKTGSTIFVEVNPNYHYLTDHYEVERDDVEFGREIGVGSFGKVYQGLLKPDNIRCAIKTVNKDATKESENKFLNEATVMKCMAKAHYIVNLIGVVSKGRPPLVLMELMELGDLKAYLRSLREILPLSNSTMIKIATEIADGMTFMESKKFVHRDLAARNCMVSGDLTIKVGDFGMARDIYETDYYRKKNRGLLPIRWMAPESLKDGEFTSMSDVWSFGVVLWEVLTMAERPYQGYSNNEVLHDVIAGRKLDIPNQCPLTLRSIMMSCWKAGPLKRPSFMQIVGSLDHYHDENFKKFAYYYSGEAADVGEDLCEYVEMQPVDDPMMENRVSSNST